MNAIFKKFNELPSARLPLTGTEQVPIMQNGVTVVVPASELQSVVAAHKFYTLYASGAPVLITGDAIQHTVLDVLIPAGALGASGVIRWALNFDSTGDTVNNVSIDVRFSGGSALNQLFSNNKQAILFTGALGNSGVQNQQSGEIATETISSVGTYARSLSLFRSGDYTVNFAVDQHFQVKLQLFNSSNFVRLNRAMVEVYPT